jgi:hypothetical protein
VKPPQAQLWCSSGVDGVRSREGSACVWRERHCWRQKLTSSAAAAAGARLVSKVELSRTGDVVSIHMVLSRRTTGLIGAAEFALMKATARLVVEAALLDAHANHRISGAVIDVYPARGPPLPTRRKPACHSPYRLRIARSLLALLLMHQEGRNPGFRPYGSRNGCGGQICTDDPRVMRSY